HAPHTLRSSPHFLVHTRTKKGSRADVFHIDLKSNAISKAYDLPLLEGGSAFSTSSSAANVYFTRVTSDEVIITSSVSHGILGRWSLNAGAQKLDAIHGVSEVIKKSEDNFAVRSAVVTDEDDWTQIVNGDVSWTRPEGLSGAVAATWAEIPESEDLAKTLEAEAHTDPWSAFVHRVTRHIDELRYLPAYLQTLPERISAGLLGLETAESGETLSRDSFGFNKLVVLATKRGKLYGLETGNHGRIVWSKSSSETPGKRPWNVRAIYADDVNGIVTVRGADGEFIIVKSDTGKTVESIPTGLFPPVESAVLVDSEAGPWLLPIGEGGKIAELNSTWAPKQTIVTRTSDGGIRGVKFLTKGEQAVEIPTWTFNPPAGQKIVE
ncbi:hypothetical protein PC116_g30977, partial [Phytophthora cactorum]